nr:hypothetical protein [Tanacetum cinerariifolium]
MTASMYLGNAPSMSLGNAPSMSSGNAPSMSSGNAPSMSSGNAPSMSLGNASSPSGVEKGKEKNSDMMKKKFELSSRRPLLDQRIKKVEALKC